MINGKSCDCSACIGKLPKIPKSYGMIVKIRKIPDYEKRKHIKQNANNNIENANNYNNEFKQVIII